jgi:hypothetical protein
MGDLVAAVTNQRSRSVMNMQGEGWMMAKVDMSDGRSAVDQRADAETPKSDYRTPKLTVVGTVHDLTLGTGNRGRADGIYLTSQAG